MYIGAGMQTSTNNMLTETLSYPNGDRYIGQVGRTTTGIIVAHGYGTSTKANGETYTGHYYEGHRHGQGQSYSPISQRHYNGGFVYDREEGYATITMPGNFGGQRQYIGYMSNNQRQGQGQQWETAVTGQVTVFEGMWSSDQLNGQGKYTISGIGFGQCYEGSFVNGKLEGLGTYTDTISGAKYKGLFQGGNVIQWYGSC